MSNPNQFANLFQKYENSCSNVRERFDFHVSRYLHNAKKIGYLPLTGLATTSGLLSVLAFAGGDDKKIDPSKLPDTVKEAFKLQYPNEYAKGRLDNLTPESAEPLLKGWVGKLTEIRVRDRLNSGESIGNYSLAPNEKVMLATDPTQEGWDLIVQPTGTLLQVKATKSIDYLEQTASDLEDSGIIIISTNLPDTVDISETGVQLLEIAESKEELDKFMDASLEDAAEGFEIFEDLLGPLALAVSGYASYQILKLAVADHKSGKSFTFIGKRYGARVAGRVAAMVSPIPFTGRIVRWYIDSKIVLSEALEVATRRLERVEKIDTILKQKFSKSYGRQSTIDHVNRQVIAPMVGIPASTANPEIKTKRPIIKVTPPT